jgi:hypothetical protein
LEPVVEGVTRLLEAGRARENVPIAFTAVAFGEQERDSARALLRKMSAAAVVEPGTYWTQQILA